MATPTTIRDIYDIFLGQISDYSYLSLDTDILEEEMLGFFNSAKRKFQRKCKSDLTLSFNDELGEDAFNDELDDYEIDIIVTFMLVAYMRPRMIASETISQSLSDKDFKIYSQANQLREISLLYRQLKSEAEKMVTKYTYLDLGEKDD